MRLDELQKAIEEERQKVNDLQKQKEELTERFDPYVNMKAETQETIRHEENNTPKREPVVQEKMNHSFDLIRMSKQKESQENKWIRSINSTLGLDNRNKIIQGSLNPRVISSLERMPVFRKNKN